MSVKRSRKIQKVEIPPYTVPTEDSDLLECGVNLTRDDPKWKLCSRAGCNRLFPYHPQKLYCGADCVVTSKRLRQKERKRNQCR